MNLISIITRIIVCSILPFCYTSVVLAQYNPFTHGVASGDPDLHSVVLWTRVVQQNNSKYPVSWQIAKDSLFNQVVNQGTALATQSQDFCVKVIADKLTSGTTYFYRFGVQQSYSPIGHTKTLPKQTRSLKIGVANCAKYTGGYYHAYEAMAKIDDLDVVIHLGDYIYESGATDKKSSYYPAVKATGRKHEPSHELLSLQDYRTRYAQYRSDTSLQKLHKMHPMIPIWDDHEIAMKSLKKLSNGELQYNGDWQGRKNNSIQTYHEWLPIRPIAGENIYRSFIFGDLINLLMLDTRVCCKSEVSKTMESLIDTSRHIIGNQQLQWIKDQVLKHDARWNVFGNQLLFAIKDMGWNRWPGFPHDRNRFIDFVDENPTKNFLFVTGNAHNPHHYLIFGENNRDTLFHEVLPGSISSGNNAEKAFYDAKVLAKEAKRLENAENVLWYNQDAHGFIILDIKPERLNITWHFVTSIRDKSFRSYKEREYVIYPNSE